MSVKFMGISLSNIDLKLFTLSGAEVKSGFVLRGTDTNKNPISVG